MKSRRRRIAGSRTAQFSTPAFSLTAPVLAFVSATDPDSDNTQDFNITVTAPAVDDVLTLQWSTTSNFAVVSGSATYTILAADLIDLTGEITTGALADGLWYFRVKHSRGGSDSAWSNTVSKTITTASPFDHSFLGSFSDATNGTVFTIPGAALGTADADRKIAIAFLGPKASPGAGVTSVTIAGVAASAVSGAFATQTGSGVTWEAYIYEAAVPTGTTGDIVITFANTVTRCGGGWWRVVSGTSSAGAGGSSATGANALTPTIPANGVGLFFSQSDLNAAHNAWTNLSTEDFDTTLETLRSISGGRRTVAGSTAVTANVTSTGDGFLGVCCAYGP